ncbi:TPA: hypothetical protein NO321_006259, partial [Pseudomonas aeruginosa]|nr:hypothetical protein [Pseudomonas aeruginosa]
TESTHWRTGRRGNISRGGFEIVFPRRLAWLMKGMRLLPYPAYFWMVRRLAGEHRGGRRDGAV